ncbi:MAG: hypothetical protein ABSC15_17755 [Terriglobales bacterium]|jgi:hypothetical protein
MTITLRGRGSGYAASMYTIHRAPKNRRGVTLTCKQCSHAVSVNEFNESVGCARTQAAQAMLKHVHNEHSNAPTGKPMAQTMERWY